MDKNRLNLTISFGKDKEIYNYVKNKPNSSHYIRELIKADMKKEETQKQNQINTNIIIEDYF